MDILLQTYYLAFPIVLTALMGWIGKSIVANKKEEQKRKEEAEKRAKEADRVRQANSAGLMLILRYMLKRYHSEYMLQGAITYAQYADWKEAFAAYTDLGGNSIAQDWDADIEALPRTDSIPSASPFEHMLRKSMEEEG